MRIPISIVLLGASLFAGNLNLPTLSLSAYEKTNSFSLAEKKYESYTIQYLSVKKFNKTHLKYVLPKEIYEKSFFQKKDGYTVAYFSHFSTKADAYNAIRQLKKEGFRDAFVKSTHRLLRPNKIKQKNKKTIKLSMPKPPVSDRTFNKVCSMADKAFNEGKLAEAATLYETILSNKRAHNKILINLSYIYGKLGSFDSLQRLLKKKTGVSFLLYAYARGSVEIHNKEFYKNFKDFIEYDNSGLLSLLAGYYFEKDSRSKKALEFYRKAYKKNASQDYSIFAYARALDINHDYKKALSLYRDIAERENSALSEISRERYNIIKRSIR